MNSLLPDTWGADAELSALSPFEPRRSAADMAYERLRHALITLALPPGAVVSRGAVAQRLGISQTPVREALLRLGETGLVRAAPGRSTVVAEIDLAEVREAHAVVATAST